MSQEEEELQELESLLLDHFGRTPANFQEIHEETSEDRDEQSDFPLEEECEVVIEYEDSAECSDCDYAPPCTPDLAEDGQRKQINFLVDEDQTIGQDGSQAHGPDSVISMLDWVMSNYETENDVCSIHADNSWFMLRVLTQANAQARNQKSWIRPWGTCV
ncbi:hypothetical protein DPMN_124897, partial [Dreissena polymorpha]